LRFLAGDFVQHGHVNMNPLTVLSPRHDLWYPYEVKICCKVGILCHRHDKTVRICDAGHQCCDGKQNMPYMTSKSNLALPSTRLLHFVTANNSYGNSNCMQSM
jgi:hypothetical protein